jgi:hypothetical protein
MKTFESDGTREIEYVIIEDSPSKEDQAVKSETDALYQEVLFIILKQVKRYFYQGEI